MLCDLVSVVQFKKRGKHLWKNDTLSKIAGLLCQKQYSCMGVFSLFLNCTNGTNLCNAPYEN